MQPTPLEKMIHFYKQENTMIFYRLETSKWQDSILKQYKGVEVNSWSKTERNTFAKIEANSVLILSL